MEQITNILQGGYAYLLIFQILVVSSLFVMLMVMIIRRIRMEAADGPALGAMPAILNTATGISQEEYDALKAQLAALEEDRKNLERLRADNTSLLEKIKFLEGKLLEYEILQEEIGSLSNLKVENEKLKKELLGLQKDIGKTGAQIEQLAQEVQVAPTTAPANPPEKSSEPAMMQANAPADGTPGGPTEGPNLDNLLAEIDALAGTPGQKEAPKA